MKWLGFYRNLREVKQLRGKQWFSWAARQSVCRATHGLCGQEFHVMSPAETFKSELYVWPVRLCSFLFLKIMDFHPYSLDLLCFTHHFPEFSKEAVCGNNRWTKNYQGLFYVGEIFFEGRKREYIRLCIEALFMPLKTFPIECLIGLWKVIARGGNWPFFIEGSVTKTFRAIVLEIKNI